MSDAAARWSAALLARTVPAEILDAAPATPHFYDPDSFAADSRAALERVADSVSDQAARTALAGGARVLDVGCGAGAASLRLLPEAREITGVDESDAMLERFRALASERGAQPATILGSWPLVEERAPVAEVVCCHHVVYNVADIGPFLVALAHHATRLVVIECSSRHPLAWTAPFWRALHGLEMPEGPSAADLVEVLGDLGIPATCELWERPLLARASSAEEARARIARRLCVGPEREGEIAELMARFPFEATRQVATLTFAP